MFSSRSVPTDGIPDDPRYSSVPSPVLQDVSDLSNNKFLTSSLIEWIIHHSYFLYSKSSKAPPNFYVCPVWFDSHMESILWNSSSMIAQDIEQFNAMRRCYKFLKKGDHKSVIPHFNNQHFTVVKMLFNLENI